jgi:hypothetical protein
MELGKLVHNWALGRDGIVVDGAFTEDGQADGQTLEWEWLVLYDGGELIGADTNDLKVIDENH